MYFDFLSVNINQVLFATTNKIWQCIAVHHVISCNYDIPRTDGLHVVDTKSQTFM